MTGRAAAARLAVEFLAVFGALPALLITFRHQVAPRFLPILLVVAAACLMALLRDPSFDRRSLLRTAGFRRWVPGALARWLPGIAVLALVLAITRPEMLFFLPRERPLLWGAIVLLYPILSVVPQGLIFRSFLMHRYRPLFPSERARVLVSALTFGATHALLGNWIAPALATLGGLLFARTYTRTSSGLLASLEHALWGDAIFTLGVGWWFYGGSIGAAGPPG